ncbi:MAG TPA: glycosyltransferase family 2 protein [Candidatus Krumholzibacteria bacterium]|jgi:glycosyltransferase involved in cell wall biosynthesis
MSRVWILIPALNEEESLPHVLRALPERGEIEVVVCDNGSSDATARRARELGATVVLEERHGYGRACLRAMAELDRRGAADRDLVCFVDADFSDDPSQLDEVLEPLRLDRADLVIGSRVLGQRETGSLLPQARFGNWLATRMIRRITGVRFTDLGPFRALRWGGLRQLDMRDEAFGWTVEMQLKAAAGGLRCVEVPVRYRRRIGKSKITGTLRGTFLASVTILSILLRWRFGHRPAGLSVQ